MRPLVTPETGQSHHPPHARPFGKSRFASSVRQPYGKKYDAPGLPRFLKLNGHARRAQRTPTEEFYELTAANLDMVEINQVLRKWKQVYDTVPRANPWDT